MRLELLIRESRGGILGAQIPELYRDRFGEPLDLRNKKLKDVLLCIESVEMFAAKGSGDKIYRVVDDLSSMPMRSAALPATAVVANTPRATTNPHETHDLSAMSAPWMPSSCTPRVYAPSADNTQGYYPSGSGSIRRSHSTDR